MKGRDLLDAVEGGVALVVGEESDAQRGESAFEVTLYDHARYPDPAEDPNARTITVTAEEVLEFFGR